MKYKAYKDNKYNNKRAKIIKKTKRNIAIASVLGGIIICVANMIPVKTVDANSSKKRNSISVETIDNKEISHRSNNKVLPVNPFNVGSSPDKNMVIEYLNSFEGSLIYKYASDYGVDPYIIASIAMQETTLNHNACIPGGEMYSGYGVGLLQLESPTGEEVRAFDYSTNEWVTEYITMDNACNIEKNIKIGCMLFQNKISENNGNIFLATLSHNYGQVMINMMMDNLYGKNARNIKMDYSNTSWLSEVKNIHNNPNLYLPNWNESSYGDGDYLEHVFRFCPTDEVKYKYGAYEYTFNLKTMQVTDMFEYSTSIKK